MITIIHPTHWTQKQVDDAFDTDSRDRPCIEVRTYDDEETLVAVIYNDDFDRVEDWQQLALNAVVDELGQYEGMYHYANYYRAEHNRRRHEANSPEYYHAMIKRGHDMRTPSGAVMGSDGEVWGI